MKHYLYQENTLKYFETFFCFALSMLKQTLKLTCQLGLLTFSTALLPFTAFSEDPPRIKYITVKGQVRLSPASEIPPEGLDVVLLKFVLNHEGEVTPIGPQGRVKTNSLGNYKFVKVPTDFRLNNITISHQSVVKHLSSLRLSLIIILDAAALSAND